jgi:hypothetical protein
MMGNVSRVECDYDVIGFGEEEFEKQMGRY